MMKKRNLNIYFLVMITFLVIFLNLIINFYFFYIINFSFLNFLTKNKKKKEKDKKDQEFEEMYRFTEVGKKKTDIDVLYEILEERKELKLSDIIRIFKINKETALEWAKILENANLATLDYPIFREPILRLINKNITKK